MASTLNAFTADDACFALANGGGTLELSEIIDVKSLKDYVMSRRASDGGFAFCYPLPSSLPETYYAVYILKVLKEPIPNRDKLILYLKNSLKMNPHSVFFVLNTLKLIGEELPDLTDFVVGRLKIAVKRTYKDVHLESGITATYSFDTPNVLREVYSLVSVLRFLKKECKEIEEAKKFVERYRKDGGFGVRLPNLEETFYCVSVLNKRDERTIKFIMDREWRSGGFSKVPGSYPPYIEDTYYAVESLHIMGERYKNTRTIEYIASLQNADGGFRRSIFVGTSSLEFSYYAIAVLEKMCK